MNPARIAIMTIAAVSATTFAYTVFAPSPSKMVAKPTQTQVAVSSAPVISDNTPVIDSAAQTQPEIQYIDVPAPRQNVRRDPQENEDQNGDNNE
jgi:hypothetical protein